MALPHDERVQIELLRLLADAPNHQMDCNDVYGPLAKSFPHLTSADCNDPYHRGQSRWVNCVQWARQHLVMRGLILRPYAGGGRGYWTISAEGRKAIAGCPQASTLKEIAPSPILKKGVGKLASPLSRNERKRLRDAAATARLLAELDAL